MKPLPLFFSKIVVVLWAISAVQNVAASPQRGKGGGYPQFEMRSRPFSEIRAHRQAIRQAKQAQFKEPDVTPAQTPPPAVSTPLSSSVQQNQGAIDREPNARFNRLTPEERQALRRQIKEARREIYLQRQQ